MLNSKQLQYAIVLSKIRNFSEAAEKLNISQPALSKQIMHLEKELGVKLFNRDSTPLEITQAGALFIREAESLLYKEDQLLRKIEQFKSEERGRLVIGISQFRSLYMLPEVVRKLTEKYPHIQVCVHEADSQRRKKNMEEGKYDFAVVNLPVDETVFDVIPLKPDTLVLAVPNGMLRHIDKRPDEHLAQIDFAQCGKLPFVAVPQTQELGKLFSSLCARADVTPPVVMEVFSVTTAWSMVQAGIGATILPLQFLDEGALSDKVTLFKLRNDAFLRQPAVITRHGQYLPKYARYAIDLLARENTGEQK